MGGGQPTIIETEPGLRDEPAIIEIVPALPAADRNPQRHEVALSALQAHPLVRAILPPVLLQIAA